VQQALQFQHALFQGLDAGFDHRPIIAAGAGLLQRFALRRQYTGLDDTRSALDLVGLLDDVLR